MFTSLPRLTVIKVICIPIHKRVQRYEQNCVRGNKQNFVHGIEQKNVHKRVNRNEQQSALGNERKKCSQKNVCTEMNIKLYTKINKKIYIEMCTNFS